MNTDQIAAELWDKLALANGSKDIALPIIKSAIEKVFMDDYWWKRYTQCAKDFDSLRQEYDLYRATHASEQEWPDLIGSGRRHKKPIVEGGASAVAASGTATTAQTLLGSKQCPAPENELGDSSGDASHVHIEHYLPKGYDPTAEPWKSIRQHHQSELNWAEQLRKQLALEAEKVNKLNERVAHLQRVIDEHNALASRAAHASESTDQIAAEAAHECRFGSLESRTAIIKSAIEKATEERAQKAYNDGWDAGQRNAELARAAHASDDERKQRFTEKMFGFRKPPKPANASEPLPDGRTKRLLQK